VVIDTVDDEHRLVLVVHQLPPSASW
jgi:hypothetical protein